MTNATGAQAGLAYVAESTLGTTPGSPSMLRLRNTSTTLNPAKDNFVSAELREDRQITNLRHTVLRPAGDVVGELSYGAYDDWLASVLMGAWSTNVLKAGTTLQPFSVERLHADISQYLVFKGVCPNTMAIEGGPTGALTVTFGCIAVNMTASGSSLGAPSDVATNEPFDGITGSIEEGGASIATVTGFTLNVDNGLVADYAMFQGTQASGIDAGRSNITGQVTARFANLTLLNKFLNETESSLKLSPLDPGGNELEILLPRIKYTGGDIPVSEETSLTLTLPFQALRDSSAASNIVITRTAA